MVCCELMAVIGFCIVVQGISQVNHTACYNSSSDNHTSNNSSAKKSAAAAG